MVWLRRLQLEGMEDHVPAAGMVALDLQSPTTGCLMGLWDYEGKGRRGLLSVHRKGQHLETRFLDHQDLQT